MSLDSYSVAGQVAQKIQTLQERGCWDGGVKGFGVLTTERQGHADEDFSLGIDFKCSAMHSVSSAA